MFREGEDYYLLPDGRLVMTSDYLKKRGWCCGNGCLNCPFDFQAVPEPRRTLLLNARKNQKLNMASNSDLYEAIYEIVRQIPAGRISTYGHIAAAIGMKSGARMVGYAMNTCGGVQPPVPAHRVVNRTGLLSGKAHFGPGDEMAKLLKKEGVTVKNDMVQDFARLLWDPAKELGI